MGCGSRFLQGPERPGPYDRVVASGDDQPLSPFLEVYGTLPRAGPGGDEHTRTALAALPGPAPRTVLDLGCGPGAQTIALAAALPDARILAVDLLPSMVERTAERIAEHGLADRVTAVVGDMADPPVEPASQDLIWCEGAIYHLGVTEALTAWQPLLRPGGAVAFTEAVWLVPDPPAEIREWWTTAYPAISDVAGTEGRIAAASYRTVASFVLPASAWWDEYYGPMRQRVDELRDRSADDPAVAEVLAEAESEIDHFERFSDTYSYAFFVVQPGATSSSWSASM